MVKIKISNLKPNKTIFYFSTSEHDFTKNIQQQIEAYDNLRNSGVARINKDGEVINIQPKSLGTTELFPTVIKIYILFLVLKIIT